MEGHRTFRRARVTTFGMGNTSEPVPPQGKTGSRLAVLWLLACINLLNFFDRQLLAPVAEPLRREWGLTDTQVGWLVTAFTLLYAVAGLPLGRLADARSRTRLLSAGLALWSGLTFLSGTCRNYGQLLLARLGVGVGEAVCAPAASSLIGDLYRPEERARAMSVFMLGLPAGVALSYVIGGLVAQHYGWRAAFFLAGVPGLFLSAAAWRLAEPARGGAEAKPPGALRRRGSSAACLLGIPTMRWIILSGVLHNFAMYALTFFLPSLLIRYHGVSVQRAGTISALVVAGAGALGNLAGGWAGDWVRRRFAGGRMCLAGLAVLLASPAGFWALSLPPGDLNRFLILQGITSLLMYSYYSGVYATIHDIVEPALRGTAMAVYFFAMYVLGASLGPVATGWLSDVLARRAASAAVAGSAEVFRAIGLQQAMLVVPAMALLLAGVLFAGAATAKRDIDGSSAWINAPAGAGGTR